MIGRIFGLLLGAGLGGLAYVILYPGGLEGQVPVIDLGAFESVRLGVALAAGLLGAALVIAALMRGPTRRKSRDDLPATAVFKFDDEVLDAKEAALPEEPRPFQDLTSLETLEATPVPAPEPTPETEPEPEPLATPSVGEDDAFDAARAELRAHARAEDWAAAARALQKATTLAVSDRQHMLAAQDAGDFARAQGRMDDAIEAYDLALAHARLTQAPDLIADSLLNVGDMAYEEHRLDAAVDAYEAALSLRRQQVQEGGGVEARHALSIALERLADVREDRGHRTRALDLYRESEAIAAELARADEARFGGDLATTRQRLAELESRLLA